MNTSIDSVLNCEQLINSKFATFVRKVRVIERTFEVWYSLVSTEPGEHGAAY